MGIDADGEGTVHMFDHQTQTVALLDKTIQLCRKVKHRQTASFLPDQTDHKRRLARDNYRPGPRHDPADLIGSGGQTLASDREDDHTLHPRLRGPLRACGYLSVSLRT